jgi:hypothetical protein
MVVKKASGRDFLLRQGAGREELLDPPDLASMKAAACSRFHGKLIGPLGFSRRGEYIGGRAASGGGPGGSPPGGAGQGFWLRRPRVWPGPGPPPSLLWTPTRVWKK